MADLNKAIKAVEENWKKINKKNKYNINMYTFLMKMPITRISIPKIDADETLVHATVTGNLSKGGIVTATPQVCIFLF